MQKLYRQSAAEKFYWETWENQPGQFVVHWGVLGTPGQTKNVSSGLFSSAEKQVAKEMQEMIGLGYAPIEASDHAILMIEYTVEGFGTEVDLEKRNRLMQRMDETLGWTGLGHYDGGSIGSGTMEVCNFVVDFEIAKQVIEQNLAETEFADFSRLYREDP